MRDWAFNEVMKLVDADYEPHWGRVKANSDDSVPSGFLTCNLTVWPEDILLADFRAISVVVGLF
jgi:hypothetical protein